MKRTFRQYRGKKHSELRINEDLQQLIMYLMSILKKIIKHISDTRTIVKYLRRLAKKHSPLEVDLGRFDPQDLATVFCTAIRELLLPPRKDQDQKSGVTLLKPGPGPGPGPGSGPGSESWSSEVEGSWASLFRFVNWPNRNRIMTIWGLKIGQLKGYKIIYTFVTFSTGQSLLCTKRWAVSSPLTN